MILFSFHSIKMENILYFCQRFHKGNTNVGDSFWFYKLRGCLISSFTFGRFNKSGAEEMTVYGL